MANPTLGLNGIKPELPEDPRARAAKRAAELMEHNGSLVMEENDRFYIDPAIIPDGWTYMWRVFSVLGKPEDDRQMNFTKSGWTAVPASRHPELMPKTWTGNTIEREGQILMELPTVVWEARKANDLQVARKQVGDNEAKLSGTPVGHLDRRVEKINRSFEQIAVPK